MECIHKVWKGLKFGGLDEVEVCWILYEEELEIFVDVLRDGLVNVGVWDVFLAELQYLQCWWLLDYNEIVPEDFLKVVQHEMRYF